jgi:hypothetical protein
MGATSVAAEPATPRNADGGFGPVSGALSEPESTAFVALAYGDRPAGDWLRSHQGADGAVEMRVGSVARDVSPLAAVALGPGEARERALDHTVSFQGHNGDDPLVSAFGWPWTDDTHGWTEPTAWGLLALRTLRPSAADRIADAVALFEERECVGGGWNYGTREIFDVDIPPFVQTTAVALLALGDLTPSLSARGLGWLERAWRDESAGTLTLATAACALSASGSDQAAAALGALSQATTAGVDDTVAGCWVRMAGTRSGPWSVT